MFPTPSDGFGALKSCGDLPPQFLCLDTLGEEEGLCDVNCGERGSIAFPCATTHCLSVCIFLCRRPCCCPHWSQSKSKPGSLLVLQGRGHGFGKDLHGSTFHQGLNELQEVTGDDREGIPHEQLQVSHNLYEIGHSQTKQNVT